MLLHIIWDDSEIQKILDENRSVPTWEDIFSLVKHHIDEVIFGTPPQNISDQDIIVVLWSKDTVKELKTLFAWRVKDMICYANPRTDILDIAKSVLKRTQSKEQVTTHPQTGNKTYTPLNVNNFFFVEKNGLRILIYQWIVQVTDKKHFLEIFEMLLQHEWKYDFRKKDFSKKTEKAFLKMLEPFAPLFIAHVRRSYSKTVRVELLCTPKNPTLV